MGLLLAMATSALPVGLVGSPFPVRRFQVDPPSVLFQIPLPGPPPVRPQVWITSCQVVAKRTRGFFRSISTS